MGIVKIKKANIGDQVFTQLKDQIINGEWRPGDRIPSEAQLIQLFGVSRGTIREAAEAAGLRGHQRPCQMVASTLVFGVLKLAG